MPMMSDARFAPDTLFIVAEDDWRLWRTDCRGGRSLDQDAMPAGREGELAAPSAEAGPWSSLQAASSDAGRRQSRKPRRQQPAAAASGPTGWGRPKKAKKEEFEQTSQELCDVVHMCNFAHRHGKGELVWLSWNASAAAKWTPTFGSSLIAVSARGARILQHNFDEQFPRPDHWDLCLKGALQTEAFQEVLASSYIYPSLGGYDDHVSAFMNTKRPEVRGCDWDLYKNRQEGTRELHSEGRAFSRPLPWIQWELKLFPFRQKKQFERIVATVPTLPSSQPDIWWTAAASIGDDFYAVDREARDRGIAKKNKAGAAAQKNTGRSRSKSPTKQTKKTWVLKKPVNIFKSAGVDPEPGFHEIQISHEQLNSMEEISEFKTQNAARRKRDICANFERRFFTNDPKKAGSGNFQS